MKDFQLQLNSPPGGIYYPGMTVTGTLLVVTDKPKNYKSIQVKLHGFAKVRWTEQQVHGKGTRIVTYSSSEDYKNTYVTFWGEGASSGRDILPAGTYQFPFSFPVRENLPSSYDSKVGKIKYIVEARIVNGSLKRDYVCEREILFKDRIDIIRPELLSAKSVKAQGTLCCWCCESEPIVIRVNIPHVGYYIQQGNSIPVTVSVENQTDRRIEGETITLRRKVSYIAGNKTRSYRDDLVTIQSLSIPAQSTRETQHLLPIPSTILQSLMNSNIIQLEYYVNIRAVSSIKIPVVLGFPWQDAVSGQLPQHDEECHPPLGVITKQPVS